MAAPTWCFSNPMLIGHLARGAAPSANSQDNGRERDRLQARPRPVCAFTLLHPDFFSHRAIQEVMPGSLPSAVRPLLRPNPALLSQ